MLLVSINIYNHVILGKGKSTLIYDLGVNLQKQGISFSSVQLKKGEDYEKKIYEKFGVKEKNEAELRRILASIKTLYKNQHVLIIDNSQRFFDAEWTEPRRTGFLQGLRHLAGDRLLRVIMISSQNVISDKIMALGSEFQRRVISLQLPEDSLPGFTEYIRENKLILNVSEGEIQPLANLIGPSFKYLGLYIPPFDSKSLN